MSNSTDPNLAATDSSANLRIFEPEEDATYTLEMIAELSGVDSTTILHYREQGLISDLLEAETPADSQAKFDAETLRRVRRIEHVRHAYAAGTPAIKLILGLMDEVESLRNQLRMR